MKAYLITTGVVFGMLTIAHLWRVVVESQLTRDPFFIIVTVISTSLCIWAFRLLAQQRRL